MDELTKITIRRLIKGQKELILRAPNWKETLANTLVEVYQTAGLRIEADKIKFIGFEVSHTETTRCTTRSLNDSRMANKRVTIVFLYKKLMYHCTVDITRQKFMLSQTSKYQITKDGVILHNLGHNPEGVDFICVRANAKGELDPKPWPGISTLNKITIQWDCPSRGGIHV